MQEQPTDISSQAMWHSHCCIWTNCKAAFFDYSNAIWGGSDIIPVVYYDAYLMCAHLFELFRRLRLLFAKRLFRGCSILNWQYRYFVSLFVLCPSSQILQFNRALIFSQQFDAAFASGYRLLMNTVIRICHGYLPNIEDMC